MPTTGIFLLPALPPSTTTTSFNSTSSANANTSANNNSSFTASFSSGTAATIDGQPFLPSQLIFARLAAEHHLDPLPSWTLEHRLFRETPYQQQQSEESAPPNSTTGANTYLQILTLSFHAGKTYAAITKPSPSPASAAAPVPSPAPSAPSPSSQQIQLLTLPSSSADELSGLLLSRFAPLWLPPPASRARSQVVTNGQAYAVGGPGNFVIRFGEIRDGGGGSGGKAGHVRGTVVQVTWNGEEGGSSGGGGGGAAAANVGEVDKGGGTGGGTGGGGSSAEDLIRGFWAEVGGGVGTGMGGREIMDIAAPTSGVDGGNGTREVRQWLEALRVRA